MPVVRTPLSGYLNAWANEMQVSPWWWNQLAGLGDGAPLSQGGANIYVQPDWIDIAKGINRALQMMADQLSFYPRPVYLTDRIKMGRRSPFEMQSLKTTYGYIQAIGSRATSVLSAGNAVVYSDEDGDGVNDTGTVTFADANPPDESEIQMFFTVADINQAGATAASEVYQIEPATVVIAGGNVELTAHIGYFVKPPLWRQPYEAPNYNPQNKNVLDTQDAANYVTTVDVYRVYPDATNAVTLRRRKPSCSTCTFAWDTATGTAEIERDREGLINISSGACNWLCGGWGWPRNPSYVDVAYYAGYPLDRLTDQAALTEALTRLANTKMPRDPNTFDNVISTRWQHDNGYPVVNNQAVPMQKTPFGLKNGQVEAWEVVTRYMLGVGMSL